MSAKATGTLRVVFLSNNGMKQAFFLFETGESHTMIKYKALVPCLFLLGAMGISTAKADQVVFNNGDRLSGTIISMRDARTLYFRSNIAGDMRIGWGDVSELYDDNLNMIAIPEAPPPLVSPLTGINDSAVQTWTQTTEKGRPKTPAISGENSTETLEDDNAFKWSGRANLGGRLDDGNSRSKAVTFDADIKAGMMTTALISAEKRIGKKMRAKRQITTRWHSHLTTVF